MPRPRKTAQPSGQAQQTHQALVTPLVASGSESHVFQELEATDKLPVLVSVGYTQVAPNSRDYVSYVITSRGREVLSIEVSEPNLRAIASDEAKINFVTLLEDVDREETTQRAQLQAERGEVTDGPTA